MGEARLAWAGLLTGGQGEWLLLWLGKSSDSMGRQQQHLPSQELFLNPDSNAYFLPFLETDSSILKTTKRELQTGKLCKKSHFGRFYGSALF